MATSFFETLMEEKPKVNPWKDLDPTLIQGETIAGNLSNFADAKKLADQVDARALQQLLTRLRATFPEFAGLQEQGAKVISDRLAGVLSTSDAAASQRGSAARALGLGVAGSPYGAGLTLRDLGIKQYQAQSDGMGMLPGYASTVAGLTRAPSFDLGSMFLTPQQRWSMTYQNQAAKWNQQWLANQIDAMPSGIGYAFAKQADQDIEMAKQAAVSYFGGSLGGSGSNSRPPPPPPEDDAWDPSAEYGNMPSYNQQRRMMNEYYGR